MLTKLITYEYLRETGIEILLNCPTCFPTPARMIVGLANVPFGMGWLEGEMCVGVKEGAI